LARSVVTAPGDAHANARLVAVPLRASRRFEWIEEGARATTLLLDAAAERTQVQRVRTHPGAAPEHVIRTTFSVEG
jgi:hypothetical protein